MKHQVKSAYKRALVQVYIDGQWSAFWSRRLQFLWPTRYEAICLYALQILRPLLGSLNNYHVHVEVTSTSGLTMGKFCNDNLVNWISPVLPDKQHRMYNVNH